MLKKILCMLLCLCMIVSMAACGASDTAATAPAEKTDATDTKEEKAVEPEYILKYGCPSSEESMSGQGCKYLGNLIEEYSGGRIKVEYYFNGILGDKIQNMESLRAGTLEMCECAITDMSNFDPQFSVFGLPFLVTNADMAYETFCGDSEEALALKAAMEEAYAAYGLKPVNVYYGAFRDFANKSHPIESIEDCKGLKVRTLQDKYIAKSNELFGFSVVTLGWSEVYSALQQGTIDGADNGAAYLYDAGLYEVAKYISRIQYVFIPSPQLISLAWYENLPADLQEAVDKAAKDAETWYWDFALQYDEEARQKLIDGGAIINDISEENLAEFVEAVQPVYDTFLQDVPEGKNFYDLLMAAKAAY